MPLAGKGRFYKRKNDGFITVSGHLTKDSQFPFHDKERLNIKIDVSNKSLIITKEET